MDDMAYSTVALVIRSVNFGLWSLVVYQIIQHDQPVPRIVRQLVGLTIVFGMFVLALGGLVPFGLPADLARLIYTAFTVFAGIVAAGILSSRILDDEPNGR